MAKIISQAGLSKGLVPIDEELAPSSAGRVSDRGMHIPDTGLIDAFNVLPTIAGYTSFFGTEDNLETTPLDADIQVQEMLVFKTLHGNTIQLAFCSDGLYLRSLAGDGTGVKTNVPAVPPAPEHDTFDLPLGKAAWINVVTTIPLSSWKMWTYALMGNKFYVYQKGLGYIGVITSYKPNQVVFEHLPPSYINTPLTRHVFTFSSEDYSEGDTTWKAIQFTTDTGLDFGVQQIPIDTGKDVEFSIEAWETAFLATGLFSFSATQTSFVPYYDPSGGNIGTTTGNNPANFLILQVAAAAVIHDGSPADLTLEASETSNLPWVDDDIIQISGHSGAEGLTYISYGGNIAYISETDDLEDVRLKLIALYRQDPVLVALGIGLGLQDIPVYLPYRNHYTFTVAFTLVDPAAAVIATITKDGTSVITEDSHTQTLIPMGHVEGIMSGKSRLVAWDIDNLIYNSSGTNLVDFTPSAATGANQVSVPAIKGKIIKCEGHTDGFVIYATGNIVIATFSRSATSIYKFTPLVEAEGITDYRHLAAWKDMHYYWSSKGLVIISPNNQKSEFIFPEMTDWIKKYRYPIEISLLAGRFLVVSLRDRDKVFSNRTVRLGGTTTTYKSPHVSSAPIEFDEVFPALSLYSIKSRSLVLDIQLGKWGTCDTEHKKLVSLTPYNQSGYQIAKNYELISVGLNNEQRELAVLLGDGYTRICNDSPTDSYVLFGHYAAHRDKMTKLVEVDTEYVDYPDATLEIEASQDGAKIDWPNKLSFPQTTLVASQGLNIAARWFNILISGRYHLKRVLIKGYKYGRK